MSYPNPNFLPKGPITDPATNPAPETPTRSECFKALACLYLATDQRVADDLNTKVRSYIFDLERALAEAKEKNCKYLVAGGEALDLLRGWMHGGECFCTPEGCASKEPCDFCKTQAFLPMGRHQLEPYDTHMGKLRQRVAELESENERLKADKERTRLILQAGYEANRIAFSPSKILDVFQAALMSLAADAARTTQEGQG